MKSTNSFRDFNLFQNNKFQKLQKLTKHNRTHYYNYILDHSDLC